MAIYDEYVELSRLCWRQAHLAQTEGVAEMLRKMAREVAICALNKALHPILHRSAKNHRDKNHTKKSVFTQPGSQATFRAIASDVAYALITTIAQWIGRI